MLFRSDCLSGMCGDDEVTEESGSLTASGTIVDRSSDGRLKGEVLRLCLNQNGVHDEDGDVFHLKE